MQRLVRPVAVVLAIVVCLSVTSAAAADPLGGLRRVFRKWDLFQGVKVSGQNTLTFQEHLVDGSGSAFTGQRWDTDRLQRRTSLHLEGPIFKEFGFQADLSASGWGPSYSRWVAGYVGHDTAVYFGDLNISLRGNEFTSFSKSLKGWQLDHNLPGNGMLRAFQSKEKGFTRNQTMAGNDTPGPYFLTYTPITEGSERVKVDEQPQRLGEDYRIDYQTGELWFEPVDGPPQIIPSTSTISVSYRSSGYMAGQGTLSGLRAEMPVLADNMVVGLMILKQDRPGAGSGDTAGYQEDYYQGSGSTGPFDTNFRPIIADGAQVTYQGEQQTIDEALIVLVDNVQQEEGVDYDAYRQIGRIIFRRAVPPTALVKIQYYYDLRQTTPAADTQVTGLDVSWRISKDLSLRADFARSTGGTAGQPGQALQGTLTYSQPRLAASAEYRDMDSTFSFIDTTGFRRQEKGMAVNLQWQPHRHIELFNRYSKMKTAQGLSFGYSGYGGGYGFGGGGSSYYGLSYPAAQAAQTGTSTTGLDVSARQNELDLRLDFPGWPAMDITRQTMSNAGGSMGGSNYTSTSLRLNHTFSNRLRLNATLGSTNQSYGGDAAAGADDLSQPRGSSTRRRQVSVDYMPFDDLSLSADLGHNRSAGSGGTTSNSSSSNIRLSARWRPSDRLSINLDQTVSESIGRVSSGFYGGFPGSGYSGGGGGYWPGPIAGGGGSYPYQADDGEDSEEESQTRYEDGSTSLGINYLLSDDVSLSFNTRRRQYTSGGGAGYLADSDQRSHSLSASWRATDALTVSGTLSKDNLDFLSGDQGAVANNMLNIGLSYQPPEQRWGVSLSMNRMSGSSPTYIEIGGRQRSRMVSTALFDLSGQIQYRVGDDAHLYLRAGLSDFNSAYSAFKKNTAELGLGYQLNDNSELNFGYRYIKHMSGDTDSPFFGYTGTAMQSQDYIANTFMLTFSTRFATDVGGRSAFQGPVASFGAPSSGGMYQRGGIGGTNLATFGGYQAGSRGPSQYGPFGPGAGYGGGYQSGYGGGYGGGGYEGREGFGGGWDQFQQQPRRGERTLALPPAQMLPQPTEPERPGREQGAGWPVTEGLSRWQIPDAEELW